MKKLYKRPELGTVSIKLGVFGEYGSTTDGDGCDNGGHHHGGHHHGGSSWGGWGGWWGGWW